MISNCSKNYYLNLFKNDVEQLIFAATKSYNNIDALQKIAFAIFASFFALTLIIEGLVKRNEGDERRINFYAIAILGVAFLSFLWGTALLYAPISSSGNFQTAVKERCNQLC